MIILSMQVEPTSLGSTGMDHRYKFWVLLSWSTCIQTNDYKISYLVHSLFLMIIMCILSILIWTTAVVYTRKYEGIMG